MPCACDVAYAYTFRSIESLSSIGACYPDQVNADGCVESKKGDLDRRISPKKVQQMDSTCPRVRRWFLALLTAEPCVGSLLKTAFDLTTLFVLCSEQHPHKILQGFKTL